MLDLNVDDLLWLNIRAGSAFKAEGHHPIIAGCNLRGEKLYIACFLESDHSKLFQNPCTVADGAASATYRCYRTWKRKETKTFSVLVLRQDPVVTDSAEPCPSWRKGAGDTLWNALTTKSKLLVERRCYNHANGLQRIKRRSGTFVDRCRLDPTTSPRTDRPDMPVWL